MASLSKKDLDDDNQSTFSVALDPFRRLEHCIIWSAVFVNTVKFDVANRPHQRNIVALRI